MHLGGVGALYFIDLLVLQYVLLCRIAMACSGPVNYDDSSRQILIVVACGSKKIILMISKTYPRRAFPFQRRRNSVPLDYADPLTALVSSPVKMRKKRGIKHQREVWSGEHQHHC